MSDLATIKEFDRIGSSTDFSNRTWLIPESTAPTDTPPPVQDGGKKALLELFGTGGQSVALSLHPNYATVVFNVDLAGVADYGLIEESGPGGQYSITLAGLNWTSAYADQFFEGDVLTAEASTQAAMDLDAPDPVSARLDELLVLGEGYVFQDGMHSPFSLGLIETIGEFGLSAFDAIEDRLGNDGWPATEAGEAMRWIGVIDAPETLLRRVELLEHALQHESFVVREGAVLGLMYAESEEAVEFLEKALEVETHPLVRLSIEETLEDIGGLES